MLPLTALRDEFVRLRRFRDAARMIVRDDYGGRIALQGELHNLARMHAGALRVPFFECLQIR